MHKTEAIINAAHAATRAGVDTSINVFKHRALSLSEEYDELPAISIDFGEDAPLGGDTQTLDGRIMSVLTINATAISIGVDELEVREQLLELRSRIHQALRSVPDLGLEFVIDTTYGGANAPEFLIDGDRIVGELVTQWGVIYEFELDNPEA